jgi:hypothetical protein
MLARVARAIAEPAQLFGEDQHFWKHAFSSGCTGLSFSPTPPP